MLNVESCPLFQHLSDEERAELRRVAIPKSLVAGHELFKEGDPGDGIYVVQSGRISISAKMSGGERRRFSEVGPGDFFGEMAVLDSQPRSATATAAEPTELYFIPREQMLSLLTRSTGLGMALLQEISQRFREFNRQYFREVLQSERLALVGRFASSIVHDLKNPLTIIGITAEVACMEGTKPEVRRESENRIQKQITRITGMVNDILEFTKGPTPAVVLTLVEYAPFVQAVLEELRPEVSRKAVQLVLAGPPPARRLRFDPARMTRVFYNLILNAVDEMPDGGTVTVRFREVDDQLITEVVDTGRGIAQEIADRLFEPFATFGKAKGTGLGLSITQRIVEDHGGRIWAQNQEGGGAVFAFTMPLLLGESRGGSQ